MERHPLPVAEPIVIGNYAVSLHYDVMTCQNKTSVFIDAEETHKEARLESKYTVSGVCHDVGALDGMMHLVSRHNLLLCTNTQDRYRGGRNILTWDLVQILIYLPSRIQSNKQNSLITTLRGSYSLVAV